MLILRSAVIASLIIGFMLGCAGSYGKVKTQSESDAKATEKELLNNWTEYNLHKTRSFIHHNKNGSASS